jgi:hypothetical protein
MQVVIKKTYKSEHTMTNEEKRKHTRIDSLHLLNYVFSEGSDDDEATQGMGRTLNVSESGILLETHSPIAAESIISLTIGFEEDVVDIKGKVIYTKKNENNMNESGIAFFEVGAKANEILKKYIEAFNSK